MMHGMCHTWIDLGYPRVKSMADLVAVLNEHKHSLPLREAPPQIHFDAEELTP
ncbi:hypothetical protein ACTID9_02050 [Brevibacillus fluminis]|uniref:hypothetical protein n=1 Tax=Brevibacillus fluminis TaxID=511487 RepID=UPI003F8B55D6